MNLPNHHHETPWYRGRTGIVLLVFLGIAGFFVVTEHWAHAVPVLPWVLLLACPLLHVFMHGSHGGHGGHAGHGSGGRQDQEADPRPTAQKDPSKPGGTPPTVHGGHHHG